MTGLSNKPKKNYPQLTVRMDEETKNEIESRITAIVDDYNSKIGKGTQRIRKNQIYAAVLQIGLTLAEDYDIDNFLILLDHFELRYSPLS